VIAIERPSEFDGRRIAVASDELSAEQAAEAISELIPRTLEPRRTPDEALPQGVRFLFGWLESAGHHVDLEAIREEFPEVGWHRYGDWARDQLDHFRELCPHPEPVAS
jgi:hypothetical protein